MDLYGLSVYFAHSMLDYGTTHEEMAINLLTSKGCFVHNPRWLHPGRKPNVLQPYFTMLEKSDLVVAMPIPDADGHQAVGKGVYEELNHAQDNHISTLCLTLAHNSEWRFYPIAMLVLDNPDDWKRHYGRLILDAKESFI